MNSNHVPLNAYIFIGLASVIMAVVTLMDSNVADNKPDTSTNESSSVTDMLPSFSNPFSTPANEQPAQPVKDEGNMFSGMFNSGNNAEQTPTPETPMNNNGFNPFGDAANSDAGLAKEAFPINNPFQAPPVQAQPAQAQPVQAQPALFGGSKYNKTNKHKSKRNKKTKNHRKK
jgi:hypothetical protein